MPTIDLRNAISMVLHSPGPGSMGQGGLCGSPYVPKTCKMQTHIYCTGFHWVADVEWNSQSELPCKPCHLKSQWHISDTTSLEWKAITTSPQGFWSRAYNQPQMGDENHP